MPDDSNAIFHFDDGRTSFEDLGRPNGVTHWSEEVLMKSLGYATRQSFQKAITRAKQACLSAGLKLEEHIAIQPDGEHLFTRFGCYMVAMNGDSKKPEVGAAQAYFASIAETFQASIVDSDGIDRLLVRDEITDGQKSLHSTAGRHGVQNYAFFQNAGYLGMYNMGLQRLCAMKGIKKGEKLIDRMGKAEMAAHLFRITQTDEKIKNENIRGQDRLEQAAKDVGRKVRSAVMELSGKAPENLPAAEPIKDVKKKLKDTSKNMKSIDGKKSRE